MAKATIIAVCTRKARAIARALKEEEEALQVSVNRFIKELTRLVSWALREEVEVLQVVRTEKQTKDKNEAFLLCAFLYKYCTH